MSPGPRPQEVVAIGAQPLIAGLALAGVRLLPASGADEVRAAWSDPAVQGAVVVLTAEAADALGPALGAPSAPLSVVMPP